MSKIFHGGQLTVKEITNSDETIFCILEQGFNTCKLIYYIKEKLDNNKWILKSLISDNTYGETEIINNNIKVHQTKRDNKLNYIKSVGIELNSDQIEDLEDIFIKVYKQYE